MSKALLDLDSLVVRPTIMIDGKSYEILSPDELPVLTSHMLTVKSKRYDELMQKNDLAHEEREELSSLVRMVSDKIMTPVPLEVTAKLSDAHRLSVIEAFSTLLLRTKAATAAAILESTLPTRSTATEKGTGEKRSRGSNASTAGRRAGGSPKRRSHS